MSTQTVSATASRAKRVTTQTLQEMRALGTPISMLTAYDYTSARLLDAAGVDVLLVGDSASNVMAGHETTVPITLDHMIYHAQCVVRGVQRALVIVDLPFGSYQGNSDEALRSAIRVMKETGGHAVKLEGGAPVVDSIRRIIDAGIPVMGHLGLTPQSIHKFGTYQVRAREEEEAAKARAAAEAKKKAEEELHRKRKLEEEAKQQEEDAKRQKQEEDEKTLEDVLVGLDQMTGLRRI